MADQTQIEVHILLDAAGEFVVSKDADGLAELFADEHGSVPSATSMYTLHLTMPTPGATRIAAAVAKSGGSVEIVIK